MQTDLETEAEVGRSRSETEAEVGREKSWMCVKHSLNYFQPLSEISI